MKKKEEILDDEFTRKWGNSFFGCAEGYTGEQFAQTAYPLIQKSMQTYADKSCAAKDADIAELKRRIAELEERLTVANVKISFWRDSWNKSDREHTLAIKRILELEQTAPKLVLPSDDAMSIHPSYDEAKRHAQMSVGDRIVGFIFGWKACRSELIRLNPHITESGYTDPK